jgi:hypothetical protein
MVYISKIPTASTSGTESLMSFERTNPSSVSVVIQYTTFAFIEYLHRVKGKRQSAADIGITGQDSIHVSSKFCSFVLVDGMRHICAGPLHCDFMFRHLECTPVPPLSQFGNELLHLALV